MDGLRKRLFVLVGPTGHFLPHFQATSPWPNAKRSKLLPRVGRRGFNDNKNYFVCTGEVMKKRRFSFFSMLLGFLLCSGCCGGFLYMGKGERIEEEVLSEKVQPLGQPGPEDQIADDELEDKKRPA